MSKLNGARGTASLDGSELSNGLVLGLELTDDQLDALAMRVAAILDSSPPSPWLDAAGAAEYLSTSRDRIHDLVALKKLTPRRDGRRLLFKREDLDAYVESSA